MGSKGNDLRVIYLIVTRLLDTKAPASLPDKLLGIRNHRYKI